MRRGAIPDARPRHELLLGKRIAKLEYRGRSELFQQALEIGEIPAQLRATSLFDQFPERNGGRRSRFELMPLHPIGLSRLEVVNVALEQAGHRALPTSKLTNNNDRKPKLLLGKSVRIGWNNS